jgi:hypothetical protein
MTMRGTEDYRMRTTPIIPAEIRDYRAGAYTNIYQLCPDEPRLYGTESLYGDWDAELLLLAKDFAPSALIRHRLAAGDPRPYRHTNWLLEPKTAGAATNRNLERLARRLDCRKLYGSAMAGLLRDDGHVSGALPEMRGIAPFLADVLRFTLAHMPNLRAIACLGADAWHLALASFQLVPIDWAGQRATRRPVQVNGLLLFALPHPSRTPGGAETVRADWDAMAQALSVQLTL